MLQSEVDAFLEMLVAERGAARNTIDAYRQDLEQFTIFLKESSTPVASLSQVTPEQINNYLIALSREGREATTLSRRLSAFPRFSDSRTFG